MGMVSNDILTRLVRDIINEMVEQDKNCQILPMDFFVFLRIFAQWCEWINHND